MEHFAKGMGLFAQGTVCKENVLRMGHNFGGGTLASVTISYAPNRFIQCHKNTNSTFLFSLAQPDFLSQFYF